MADQALRQPTTDSAGSGPNLNSETPSQSLPDIGQPPSSNLLTAKLLNGLLPVTNESVSPLRVRKRGARRLQYQDEFYEEDAETGDLGKHSLLETYTQAGAPGAQPPVYLPKRLVTLRRKREASPIPAPNLIDALTNLLSPPSASQSGAGSSSSKVLGLGILNGGSPLTGLGILTPASEDDPFSKDGPAGNFFVE